MADIIIEKEPTTHYAARIVWTILGVVNVFLALRFILKLIAANPGAGFTDFIYRASAPLLAPFVNVVRNVRTDASGGIFEWNTLIAMAVYSLLAWVIVRLFFLGSRTDRVDYVSRP
ncbi:MAG: hypothetical protein A3I07_03890 [Candidatus Doudnabacteria bacterium RIFCSPLOWO2_02_FULL_42_9]|uniref:YggT family protein n=1 Tax=Candidatus Doudnabacteria bacterium RIFCSPHIGHO2_01_FULL_41_86 TaxID=1817821 RepID=A0A1F5N7C5_9BACT|nr:MAG: hypothetical protein A2717_03005 [Candidatus Doudnabacteria bacterium RIFCSPHIGHO2_01_FULL_41_86]OGE74664.1 MAG: hypothetical protein A3K07_02600 [Candidatus Doudnabacteria bacterium RIFCSPHIGHO2_01_43_10]OGE85023.1 MAG: hypothetical protein A3E28_04410 [Candidatus Doudnabacteria bacterium RIFCSPHIGHO2_12_FULL_42_22]OGE86464.1 MAG: hypothetical protein A3C49_04590 [Candidatus Doudnabacteria bacterium RIFCSPHIGHO2_02_FULL_42_25]OGE91926.1 MAG: hypothetical protein A2895_01355 [Candidatus